MSDLAADMREKVADLNAALAVTTEFPVTAFIVSPLAILPVVSCCQLGFRIERINVRNTASHKEKDDVFGFGREMRCFGRKRIGCLRCVARQ